MIGADVRALREAWTVGAKDWAAFAVLAATVVVAVAALLRVFAGRPDS